jgi:hypothetical protein
MASPLLGTHTHDRLISGDNVRQVTRSETIITPENRARGTVMGKITASGKLKIVNSANVDGSQTPYAVLLEAVDATAADLPGIVALSGEFNEDALVFGGADTKETHRVGLRDIGIFLKVHQSVNN